MIVNIMIRATTVIVLAAISMSVSTPALTLGNSFMLINACVCPHVGYNLTFQCTTTGPGNTIWRGSGFSCVRSGDEISLQHSLFSHPGGTIRQCGNFTGYSTIYGQSIDNNYYTSQVSTPFSLDLIGHNIQCIYDNGAQNVVVGNATISTTTEPFPPPRDINLTHVRPGSMSELTFKWSQVAPACTDIQYSIISDCGQCPTITNFTTVICHGVGIPTNGRKCSFMVKTVVCGNINGFSEFERLSVNLKVPEAPNIDVSPVYSAETGNLIGVRSTFMVLKDFNITDGFTESVISYTISYADLTTGSVCGSTTILHSSCAMNHYDTCIHVFDILSSSCTQLSSMTITVSATNIFGTGPPSYPILIQDLSNTFVDVSIDVMASAVFCTFLSGKHSKNIFKTCSIAYKIYNDSTTSTPCGLEMLQEPSHHHDRQSAESISNIVTIGLPFVHSHGKYCFIITANNGTSTVLIEGIFSQVHAGSTTYSEISVSTISFQLPFIISMTLMVLLIIMIALIAFIALLIIINRWKRKAVILASVVESVTTAEYEDIDPRPLPMSSNPAYHQHSASNRT